MKVWIETRLVAPPPYTVSGRFGMSVMFVSYWPWLNEWRWLQPGGIEERIAEPEMLLLEEDYIVNNLLETPRGAREKPARIHRGKRAEQLLLLPGD